MAPEFCGQFYSLNSVAAGGGVISVSITIVTVTDLCSVDDIINSVAAGGGVISVSIGILDNCICVAARK